MRGLGFSLVVGAVLGFQAGWYQGACGLTAAGQVECGGNLSSPSSGTFSTVSAGYQQACGVTTSGTVQCWGSAYSGAATPSGSGFDRVAAGQYGACATASDTITCWGSAPSP